MDDPKIRPRHDQHYRGRSIHHLPQQPRRDIIIRPRREEGIEIKSRFVRAHFTLKSRPD
jgi:hypothetical protein